MLVCECHQGVYIRCVQKVCASLLACLYAWHMCVRYIVYLLLASSQGKREERGACVLSCVWQIRK